VLPVSSVPVPNTINADGANYSDTPSTRSRAGAITAPAAPAAAAANRRVGASAAAPAAPGRGDKRAAVTDPDDVMASLQAELDQEESDVCPVCLVSPPGVACDPCGHALCMECLTLWRQTSASYYAAAKAGADASRATCPMCRAAICGFRPVGEVPREGGEGASSASRGGGARGSGGAAQGGGGGGGEGIITRGGGTSGSARAGAALGSGGHGGGGLSALTADDAADGGGGEGGGGGVSVLNADDTASEGRGRLIMLATSHNAIYLDNRGFTMRWLTRRAMSGRP